MNIDHMQQTVTTTPRIALTRDQLEEIRKFKADLDAGKKTEFAFSGTLLEAVAFLEGAKDIVESFSY